LITIVAYDPAWPAMFEREAARLCKTLGGLALRIEHVGSTAVPGLVAKPVIDIQISVTSLGSDVSACTALLADAGYNHVDLGPFDKVYPFFQRPAAWPSTHHVHLCDVGGVQEWRHLTFRDQLRRHPDMAAAYAELKRRLAAEHLGRTRQERERYSLGKKGFVEAVLGRAEAGG
jgi:GrpB-like predicted nucleotidyltransferase (UPF0157 family)